MRSELPEDGRIGVLGSGRQIAGALGASWRVPAPPGAVPAGPAAHRLAYLDGWRTLAVAIVIASHVIGFRHDPLWLKEIGRWLPMGEVGVLIFFFISGYVISRSALGEIGRTGRFSIAAFYTRRFFRIIPRHGAHGAENRMSLIRGGAGARCRDYDSSKPESVPNPTGSSCVDDLGPSSQG